MRTLDRYTLQARLRPALFVALPVAISVAVWFPPVFLGSGVIFGLLTAFGGTMLLAQFGRDWGKAKEPSLFEEWGGMPTSRMLRHRHSSLGRETLNRYHLKLTSLLGRSLPTTEEEIEDKRGADDIYESAIDLLRARTRKTKDDFDLVHAENINYGFRRNLWGMKPLALILCLLGIAASAGHAFNILNKTFSFEPISGTGLVLNVILLIVWVFIIKPDWVRVPADAYAKALLGTLDSIS